MFIFYLALYLCLIVLGAMMIIEIKTVARYNKKMRIRRIIGLCVLITIFVTTTVEQLNNPLRRSSTAIREYVLNHTPIGMTTDEVSQAISSGILWTSTYGTAQRGINSSRINSNSPYYELRSYDVVIGEYTMFASGSYSDFFIISVSVSITWVFDEEGRLIDVAVQKNINI